jgi:hypothetical protein
VISGKGATSIVVRNPVNVASQAVVDSRTIAMTAKKKSVEVGELYLKNAIARYNPEVAEIARSGPKKDAQAVSGCSRVGV